MVIICLFYEVATYRIFAPLYLLYGLVVMSIIELIFQELLAIDVCLLTPVCIFYFYASQRSQRLSRLLSESDQFCSL